MKLTATSNSISGRIRLAPWLAGMLVVAALGASAAPALAVDNNREDATAAVRSSVAKYYKAWVTKGRTIRVSCSGSRNVFNCDWWIIRGRFGRATTPIPAASAAEDGNHVKSATGPGTVAYAGQALAAWGCTATNKRGKCTKLGFNVSF